jgi:L-fucose mutarotase/ribose pyranase (RbsD/FucU family)
MLSASTIVHQTPLRLALATLFIGLIPVMHKAHYFKPVHQTKFVRTDSVLMSHVLQALTVEQMDTQVRPSANQAMSTKTTSHTPATTQAQLTHIVLTAQQLN